MSQELRTAFTYCTWHLTFFNNISSIMGGSLLFAKRFPKTFYVTFYVSCTTLLVGRFKHSWCLLHTGLFGGGRVRVSVVEWTTNKENKTKQKQKNGHILFSNWFILYISVFGGVWKWQQGFLFSLTGIGLLYTYRTNLLKIYLIQFKLCLWPDVIYN